MFPHPCTHCGLCCLATPCPAAQSFIGARPGSSCPALEWDETNPDQSRCGLMANPGHYLPPSTLAFIHREIPDLPAFMGSGQGCCISARVMTPAGPQDFASLPPDAKVQYTRAIRNKTIPLLASSTAHGSL